MAQAAQFATPALTGFMALESRKQRKEVSAELGRQEQRQRDIENRAKEQEQRALNQAFARAAATRAPAVVPGVGGEVVSSISSANAPASAASKTLIGQ